MSQWEALLEQLRINEELAQKFQAIEHQILTILNFQDLFKVLLSEIRRNFGVPFIWLSLMDHSEISDLVASLERSETLRPHFSVRPRAQFLSLVTSDREPLLVNRHLRPYHVLLPPGPDILMGSLAILPLRLDGELIGSLNFADPDKHRFDPSLDTDFLAQLALKVSLCLSNVTAHEKLRMMAFHDPLTGLLNRRAMRAILDREFNRATRYESPLTVVFIDLDGFKQVNDTYGHDVGDEILCHMGQQIAAQCRAIDVAVRFGGDEFVLILPQTELDRGQQLMARIVAHLKATPYQHGDQVIHCRFSYGAASTATEGVCDPETLLKAADQVQYVAKRRSRYSARREPELGPKSEPEPKSKRSGNGPS